MADGDGVEPLYCSAECKLVHEAAVRRIEALEWQAADVRQRLETAQTHLWKRVWFWLQGWPMTDWNAERRNWRPWHRSR